MTLPQVNLLNIVLMLASLGIAWILPFELFLFSYAVLGPLHYLTEISWLHDRSYFLPERTLAVPIVVLTILATLASGMLFELGDDPLSTIAAAWDPELRFAALALSLVFVVARTLETRRVGVVAMVVGLVVVHFVNQASKAGGGALYSTYDLFFVLLLTTIVHVFVFTGAFVTLGALRSRSFSGFLSLLVFLGCAVACFWLPASGQGGLSGAARGAYDASSTMLNLYLSRLIDAESVRTANDVFVAPLGEKTGRFIAYAYTYHYLNWFSKTSVIKWHEVPRSRLVSVVGIWLVSLGVYAWDYVLGLSLLFFLSLLHVFLEFPLNWRSFMDIGAEIRGQARPARRRGLSAAGSSRPG
jgi:hypothetical protein